MKKEVLVRGLLPGINCGACGFPGCDGLASAIVENRAPVNACPVGGEATGKKISEIVGSQLEEKEKTIAIIKCSGDCKTSNELYEYNGPKDCKIAMNMPNGGPKACEYGCLGFGNCVLVCKFDAIKIINNIAVIDREKCTSCGACVVECPRRLIEIIPYKAQCRVKCSSKDKGKEVKQVCSVGCIGCGICEKSCEQKAITVKENIAKVNYTLCNNCGLCKEKCPVKIIV